MPRDETRIPAAGLSGAGYELRRVFPGFWRWRVLPALGDGEGLALGRKGAMRAARTWLRSQKPPPPEFSFRPSPKPETVRPQPEPAQSISLRIK
jgi:hypothetical protein